jgi:hypothetical protein
MKRTLFFTIAILALIFFSCEKKNSQEPTTSEPDFVKLKAGNYWVYENFKVDTSGVTTDLGKTDSCYIEKDTLINGDKYFIKNSLSYMSVSGRSILKDSSGYLVQRFANGSSEILFARDNYKDIFRSDTVSNLFKRQTMMTGKDSAVSVPAGTFITRSMRLVATPLDPDYPWGVRRVYYIYGKDMGQIKYTMCFWSDPGYYEARLVRYHVE